MVDYVQIKASQNELLKKLKGWQRKVEITSLQAKRYNIILKKIINESLGCAMCGIESLQMRSKKRQTE